MKLYIQTEPEFAASLWYASLLHGLSEEARRKRYELCFLSEDADPDTAFGTDRRLLIVIATSIHKLHRQLAVLRAHQVDVLLINITSVYGAHGIHTLTMDYEEATSRSLAYLTGCGKSAPALFCIHSDSGSDIRKANAFLAHGYPESHIFWNTDGLSACCDAFFSRIDGLDAVLCANDIAVLGLMRRLRESGVRVPEDLFLMGFGDIVSTAFFTAEDGNCPYRVTTVTVDHEEIGRQAVGLYAYLYKTDCPIHITGRLESVLRIGETTAFLPEAPRNVQWAVQPSPNTPVTQDRHNFYEDAMVSEIIRLQSLLAEADTLDRQILTMLLSGATIGAMTERLYITQGAVNYRLKRIYSRLGVDSRQGALSLIREYLL